VVDGGKLDALVSLVLHVWQWTVQFGFAAWLSYCPLRWPVLFVAWVDFVMVGNGRLGLSLLWLARLGFVIVDLACLWLGMAPLWVAMVGLALIWLACIQLGVAPLCAAMVGLAELWLTWFSFGLAGLHYGWQWSTWLCYG